ncbi:MAG: Gfo/Idh/MocA family oxidoreductase [bacterium]|nr:Gfo/Idh/MocA family oxidoreductase [bacterium]
MIRIGIIGTGFGAKVHIPGFQKIKGVKITGIAGSNPAKTAQTAKESNIPLVFDTWQKLIASPEIDAVSITTPPHLHFKIAAAAFRNKKHVLCEKPLAMNAQEAQRITKIAKKSGLIHMVNFEFKNIPNWLLMKDLLQKNRLGKLRHISVNWITGGRANPKLPFIWQNDAKYGGGTLFAFGSHIVDYIEWFFGPIEKVFGKLSIIKKIAGGKKPTAEDTCDVLMELKIGVLLNLTTSNVLPNGCGHRIEIYGEKGSLKLQNSNLKDAVYGFELEEWLTKNKMRKKLSLPAGYPKFKEKYSDGRLEAFLKIAERFIKAIKTNRQTSSSFQDGLRAQLVMEAIQKSHKLQKWISI